MALSILSLKIVYFMPNIWDIYNKNALSAWKEYRTKDDVRVLAVKVEGQKLFARDFD